MIYKCERCEKTFKANYLLERHLRRKNICKSKKNELYQDIEKQIHKLDSELGETKTDLKETKLQLEELLQKTATRSTESNYKCKYCSKQFSCQNSLSRHINKGYCVYKNENISIYERELGIECENIDPLTCKFCLFKFSSKQAYSRHINKGCKGKDNYEHELEKRVLAKRREAAASISNVTNNNNCGNNITINLPPMNSFDSTNVDYITTKLLLKELQKHKALDFNGIGGIVDSFTKLIHANPAHPENHNVMFKSLNSGFARIYNGEEFEDRQSTEVQDKIIQQVGTLFTSKVLDEHNYDAKDKMTDVLDELESEWGDRTDDLKNKDNTRALSQCRNTVKAALHSKKDEIELTQQLIEQ